MNFRPVDSSAHLATFNPQIQSELFGSWADTVIAQNEAEASFFAAAARGNPARGLRLLDKFNRLDRKNRIAGTKP